jgi:hypothetical protein
MRLREPSWVVSVIFCIDFVASRPVATFECSLDGAAFAPCGGHERYETLGTGQHRFAARSVASVASAGNADLTPMPNGRKYEDWLTIKGHREHRENGGTS